jgi:hypothetical protein
MDSEEISFVCPHCARRVTADPSLAGSEMTCPHCQKTCHVPRRKIQFQSRDPAPSRPPPLPLLAPPPPPVEPPAAPADPPRQRKCPQCRTQLEEAAVLCVQCGYNLQTGKTLATSQSAPVETAVPARNQSFLRLVFIVVTVVCLLRLLLYLGERNHPAAPVPATKTNSPAAH